MISNPFCPCHMCQSSRRFRWDKEGKRTKREATRRRDTDAISYGRSVMEKMVSVTSLNAVLGDLQARLAPMSAIPLERDQ